MMPPRPALNSVLALASARLPRTATARPSTSPARAALTVGLGLGLALVLGLGLGGCYDTPQPACAFACARETNACPAGYACDPQDLICHRELSGGALAACDPPFLDAAATDARTDGPTIDAAIDAPIDAPVDAAIDAAIDAP